MNTLLEFAEREKEKDALAEKTAEANRLDRPMPTSANRVTRKGPRPPRPDGGSRA